MYDNLFKYVREMLKNKYIALLCAMIDWYGNTFSTIYHNYLEKTAKLSEFQKKK